MKRSNQLPIIACVLAVVVGTGLYASFDANAQTTTTAPKPVVIRTAPVMKPAPRPVPMRVVAMKPVVMKPVPVKPTVMKPVVATVPAMVAVPSVAPVMATVPATTMEAVKPITTTPAAKATSTIKTDKWWETFLGGLIQVILPFVLVIIGLLGRMLIKWIANKAKITDQEKVDVMFNLYQKAIDFAVNYATQQSNKLNNNPDAKGKRIKWATDKAMELMNEFGLPEKSGQWIEDAIEAKLGEKNGKKALKPEEDKPEVKEKDETPKSKTEEKKEASADKDDDKTE